MQVSLLLIGHKHEEIDHALSCTARRLRSNSAFTLDELHVQLNLVFSERTEVTAMTSIEFISGLLENMSRFNVPLPASFQYRSFNFLKSSCNVKDNLDEDVMALHPRKQFL